MTLCDPALTPVPSQWIRESRCCDPCREVEKVSTVLSAEPPPLPQGSPEPSWVKQPWTEQGQPIHSPRRRLTVEEFLSWAELALSSESSFPVDSVSFSVASNMFPFLLESARAVSLTFKDLADILGLCFIFSGFIDLFELFKNASL